MKTIASDVMTRNVMTIQEGTSTEETLKILINRKITGMPVVDSQGKMVGIVSEYGIIRQLSSKKKVVSKDFQAPGEADLKIQLLSEKDVQVLAFPVQRRDPGARDGRPGDFAEEAGYPGTGEPSSSTAA